jgi:hypothetical protein
MEFNSTSGLSRKYSGHTEKGIGTKRQLADPLHTRPSPFHFSFAVRKLSSIRLMRCKWTTLDFQSISPLRGCSTLTSLPRAWWIELFFERFLSFRLTNGKQPLFNRTGGSFQMRWVNRQPVQFHWQIERMRFLDRVQEFTERQLSRLDLIRVRNHSRPFEFRRDQSSPGTGEKFVVINLSNDTSLSQRRQNEK